MVKQTVINARLAQALALARHKDAIVLCDGNMPIPEGCKWWTSPSFGAFHPAANAESGSERSGGRALSGV